MAELGVHSSQFAKPGVDDPRQSGRLPPFTGPEGLPITTQHQRPTSSGQRRPDDVGWTGIAIGDPRRRLTSRHEGSDPWSRRAIALGDDQRGILEVDHRSPSGTDGAHGMGAELCDRFFGGGSTDEDRCGLERVDPRVVQRFSRGADALDIDAIDLMDLGDEQIEVRTLGHLDDEFIDGSTRTSFEDVNPGDIPTDGTDPTGEGAEGTGSIRHPDPEDVGGGHGTDVTSRR